MAFWAESRDACSEIDTGSGLTTPPKGLLRGSVRIMANGEASEGRALRRMSRGVWIAWEGRAWAGGEKGIFLMLYILGRDRFIIYKFAV